METSPCPGCGWPVAADALQCPACGRAIGTATPQLSGAGERLFIGRVPELERLRVVVDEVILGRGRLVLLVGDPGIDKTRTAECAAAYARSRGVAVAVGRCAEPDEGAPPFWPWIQLLRELRPGGDGRAEGSDGGGEGTDLLTALRELTGQLLERGLPGDVAEARELLDRTLETAEALGFRRSARVRFSVTWDQRPDARGNFPHEP